jgi:polysaccharide chain length determinant protein (PEP-CTERM system associated)
MRLIGNRPLMTVPASRPLRLIVLGIWNHRWLGVAVAWLVAIAGMLGIALVGDRYEASARLYVDTQTVLKPLMQGLAFQPDTDQEVRMLARTLISRPNIEQLLETVERQDAPADPQERNRRVLRLMDRIHIAPSGAGNLFAISYKDTDPIRARSLVEGLVNMFVSSNAVSKKRDSDQASAFIEEQIKAYEAKLEAAENRLKEFKVANFGVTGVRVESHFERLSRLSDEVMRLRVDLSSAVRARDVMRRELASENPQLPPGMLSSGALAAPSELDQRLEAQRRQLDELQRRFTDQHPDVVATRNAVAQLERRKQDEVERARAANGQGAATSPVFQRLRIALAEADSNVASLQAKLGALESQLGQTRAAANKVPQVEAEFAQLNRDYDVLRKNYEQMVSRREAAQLGVKIDSTTQIADFKLVEPASVGAAPVFPSRRLMAVGTLLLALMAGLGAAHAAAVTEPNFFDEQGLRAFTALPLLGRISSLALPARLAQIRQDRLRLGGALTGLLVLDAAFVVWLTPWGLP